MLLYEIKKGEIFMKVYAIEIYYGVYYEGDYFEILGIFDSKEKAEKVKIEYENSEEYKIDSKDDKWDYYNIHRAEYEINTLTRNNNKKMSGLSNNVGSFLFYIFR